MTIEVLVPDFKGALADVDTVLAANPDVFAHNLETVPRLYPGIRPGARYFASLQLLARAKTEALRVAEAAAAPISKDLLRDLVKTLPSEYLRDKSAMRYLTSVDADLDYRNSLAERATAVGDKFLEGDAPVLYSGVPVQPIPLFPENLGAGSDQTVILLCNPKNIHVGIWRQIRIESARDISEGTLKIVATLRFDVKLAEETGVAKAINVQL